MLIDTSGFLCLYESDEPFHEAALKLYDNASVRITTSYVLAEYTALAEIRGIRRSQIIEFSLNVLADDAIEIVWVDERIHSQAVALLADRPDKGYSVCDAASFVVLRERGITEALTTDKHFEQEGFIRLLC
ncbi:MAG: type II toxin-antitoxin system VapC family toxin [Chloracidobacterium sp.]|nr:type II toxin-antitoxin system VapC family toxin [Chloracidobacterium sp.]